MSKVEATQPLNGRTIVITRPLEQTAQLKALLERSGARVLVFPTIHIVPASSWDDCDRAIQNIGTYDALMLTSVNAATYFLNRSRLLNEKGFPVFAQKDIYVVGEKTRRAVENFGLNARVFQEARDGRSMAHAIIRQNIRSKKFLFPKGSLASDEIPSILREHGATVDEVVVYETRPPSQTEREEMKDVFSREEVDIVVFFSPSSINNFLSVVAKKSLNSVRIAVIGRTTAEAARKASLTPDIVADEPTTEALVTSIVRFHD
ncbi:MAG: uroporphyrinogen-III synthase [Ignavibacteriales bacterium]|nr:uroporphyrinogen-III synthase [Ignavibacteriales bacterium]